MRKIIDMTIKLNYSFLQDLATIVVVNNLYSL